MVRGMTALMPAAIDQITTLALNSVRSPASRRAYKRAITAFLEFAQGQGAPFDRALVSAYRASLEAAGKSAATCNQQLAAIRALAREARYAGVITQEAEQGIREIHSTPIRGQKMGVWLSKDEILELLAAPDQKTQQGRRDFVLLSLLVGCGLRRAEAVSITCDQVQPRDGVLCLCNLVGKGGKVRSVPIPRFAWEAIRLWIAEVGGTGALLRSFTKQGTLNGQMDDSSVFWLVEKYAGQLGFEGLAPHSLRRSFAHACLKGGANLSELQKVLGHSSLATTQRYFTCDVDLVNPICEKLLAV
jgi:site-specific recombinase XerD